jgi:hypothetical protein
MSAQLELVLEHLAGAGIDMRENGGGRWRGSCPACGGDDRLTLGVGLDGAVWPKCWSATCEPQHVLDALGLTFADLRPAQSASTVELVARPFDTIQFEPVRFLVPGLVPLGAVTLLAGDPKVGKSTWAALISAGTSTGIYGDAAVVVFVNAEDSSAAVSGPRLKAAGADLSRVHELRVNADGTERMLTLPDDVAKLEEYVIKTGARLLVLDPLFEFLSEKTEANRDHSVRRALGSLRTMAERHGVAALVCMHLNKDEQKAVLYRIGGTIGFAGLARSLLLFTRDPDDPDGARGDLRLLAHISGNWARTAPTQSYSVNETSWIDGGELVTTTWLKYLGVTEHEAAELVGKRASGPSKAEQVSDAICEALADGERLSSEVRSEVAKKLDVGHATMDRAAAELKLHGVLVTTGRGKATRWGLLSERPHPVPSDEEVVDEVVRNGSTKPNEQPPPHVGDKDEVVQVQDEVVAERGDQGQLDLVDERSNGRPTERELAEAELRELGL